MDKQDNLEQIRQIPYGVSDFRSVREQNLYYVDKSMFIEALEQQPRTLIFIRPRRFGKSLFINMMRLYYDKNAAGDFERLFGDLYIGQHPTPNRNRYQVLYLDFSRIGGDLNTLKEDFNSYCNIQLNSFMDAYRQDYPEHQVNEFYECKNARMRLSILRNMSESNQIPLYLFIDEYDNFTNVVLNEHGEEIYHQMTHASGFYREVFKLFKGMFERIFLTGVSPVTLDDLTSGFNIGWNASILPELDKMLGFSTEDVREMFGYYKGIGMLPADCDIEAMIEEMKPWYNNYCFAKECLSDSNRKGVLMKVIEEGRITADLFTSFSAMDMTRPEVFPSLLFYYGMLTITGTRGSRLILGIPNNNVRKQYYSYLLENYQQTDVNISNLRDTFDAMAFDGQWREGLQYMADCYARQSSVRDSIEGERNIQGFFLAYLNLKDRNNL